MIKKLVLTVLLVVPMCVAAQQLKLGKVDKLAIYNAMPEKEQAEVQLNDLNKQYQDEYDLLQAEYNRKYADFQTLAIDSKTPGTIKERRMQELQENNDKIELFMKSVAADLKEKEEALIAPIKEKIDAAVKAVGDEGGYVIIYDVNSAAAAYLSADFEDVTAAVASYLGVTLGESK
ncbi:MAG: OmpH family outer membrane protein [Muribaculaceae bacterium]